MPVEQERSLEACDLATVRARLRPSHHMADERAGCLHVPVAHLLGGRGIGRDRLIAELARGGGECGLGGPERNEGGLPKVAIVARCLRGASGCGAMTRPKVVPRSFD